MKGLKYKLIVVIVIVCVTAFVLFLLNSKDDGGNKESYISSGDSDYFESTLNANDNFSNDREELKNLSGDTKNIALMGMKNLRIKSGRVDVNVNFTNPKENSGLCYQVFELHLTDENGESVEVLYESDFVTPGDSLKKVNLTRAIEKGEYDAILWIKSFLMDESKTSANDAMFKIKLIAE